MTWAVVPAAGSGSRFSAESRRVDPQAVAPPKQYLEIDGEPLIAHTLRALLSHPAVAGVVVALAEGDPHWPGWDAFEGKPVRACVGGESRADSVLAGLQALPDSVRADDFVLVHDAARPNLSHADLSALLERGRADPVGAILAAPVRDTLKRAGDDGGIDATAPRERLWRALTPQLFRRLQLQRALEAAARDGVAVTDESMAMERQGARPLLVEGSEANLKITTPADLAYYRYLRESLRESVP
ncbi:MAG TPA: 2-C-methyl-D-erythritol 4-phosphate cytidylyltransferase [Luteimonas sp.]|nr:2-C-methyl-D-erythritol 4-phosphate cytidylyltransferase [Luteimonas sp.]